MSLSLDALWSAATAAGDIFDPERLDPALPEPARRYLTHAIAPGTPLASGVRLCMRGQIKLRGWWPFGAEQVILRDGTMIWRARVRMNGLPIVGSDRFVDGHGALDWRLLGLIPVMRAAGPDVDQSAAGRVAAESMWLPSALVGDDTAWSAPDAETVHIAFSRQGFPNEITMVLDEEGRPRMQSMMRWGNPGGGEFALTPFGATIEEEQTFAGYTIPSRLRVGWFIGSPRFETEGEFFRCTIDDAKFRSR